MSDHALLNLLNELEKSDKMRGFEHFIVCFFFATGLKKINNTGSSTLMLDFMNLMTLKSLKIAFLA